MIRPFQSALPARVAVALLLAAMATSAFAQSAPPTITNTGGRLPGAPAPKGGSGPAPLAPPPALPGARSQQGVAAPADKLATDMSPNDALFDAINRGDIADARDAINRGADLGSRNVLGLTPIDLSIDLGRNDITFLMLSMRGTPSGGGVGGGGGGGPKTAKAGSAPAHPMKSLPTHAPTPTLVSARTPAPAPKYPLNNDPGTPVPQAGFLGFGGAVRQ